MFLAGVKEVLFIARFSLVPSQVPMLGSLDFLSQLGAVPNLVTMKIHLLNLGVFDIPLRIARNGHLVFYLMDYPDSFPDDVDDWPETDQDASLPPGCTSPVSGQQLDSAVEQLFSQASLV